MPDSPVYIWPHGGRWPIYVADQDKRLVGIGCKVHPLEWWRSPEAAELDDATPAVIETYLRAMDALVMLAGWEALTPPEAHS